MNECVICKKEIKGYDVQYINGKYYHNCCIENLQFKIDKISEYVDKIYDVMDYKDYPPYLDEIYYTLHSELKEDK